MTCRTRFAPSPTGYLHIGGARTALYCWLEARRRNGQFLLRIEDTDRERSTQAAIDAILHAMDWLGLDYDEPPVYQTQRIERYNQVAARLLAEGKAYYAYDSKDTLNTMREAALRTGEKPRYNGAAREANLPYRDDPNRVIRFKNPHTGTVAFDDLIKGRIQIANSELDDMVILRPDGYPTYNFAVVVDDWDMNITEVIRGDDHINNTPRQINLYHALGAPLPTFAHLPMILDEQGAKLSKRTGAADVMQYRDSGYLPHALINYLVRLGWSHGDQELFNRQALIDLFQINDVNSKAARLDMAKLGWVNQHYLKTDDPATLAPPLVWHLEQRGIDVSAGPAPTDVILALRERVQTLKEMAEKAEIWYCPLQRYDEIAVAKHLKPGAETALLHARTLLAALPAWTVDNVDTALRTIATTLEIGMGKVAQPLRVAITGTQVSPDIAYTVYLTGRNEALKRIDAALIKISTA
ncbi:MAG TPA: glutamate--tRNA ligase [Xylella fastidiosa subsp. multiplex]